MSAGTIYLPLNSRAGAGILTSVDHWSSTEYYNNGGRSSYNASYQTYAVVVDNNGTLIGSYKTNTRYVRCAWRK